MYDKVSKQLFRNQGEGSFVIGPDKWTNPYVTDGLVAMWDGEWNAGGGVHDANATTWIDCVNGSIATPRTSDFSWSSNKVTTLSGCTFATNVGAGLTAATVQAVVKYAGRNHSLASTIGSFNNAVDADGKAGYGGITLGIASYYNGIVCGYAACPWSRSDFRMSTYGYSDSDVTLISLTWAGGKKPVVFYLNDITLGTVNESTLGVNSNNFSIGSTHATGGESMWGDIYAIRVYDHTLTASEIARNYRVDKERFNLP